jgi:predicted flap endonuclease-1-like 5' DNA nuclease
VASRHADAHDAALRTLQRPEETVMAVVNDLADIKGIGPKHAAMLKEIGVDSIKELQHRKAARLKEMIETRHGKVIGISEQTCQGWIDEAKTHG